MTEELIKQKESHETAESTARLVDGPIVSGLMRLSLPLIASAFMSTLYTLVDMFWVGKLGAEVMAGVGVAGMFTWLASGFIKLASVGSQVYTGQRLGYGDRRAAGKYAACGIRLSIILGVSYGLVCFLFADDFVGFFGLSERVAIETAETYLTITCGLIVVFFSGYVMTCLFTAQGNSRLPMIANFTGLILNIIIDPFLIFGWWIFPELGAAGSAIATVFSQFIVLLVLTLNIRGDNVLRNGRKDGLKFIHVEWKYYSSVIRLGIPTAIQEMFYCGISIILSRLIASFGDIAVAAMRVGGQIEAVSWNTATGFSNAINAFVSQNFGAGKPDRIRKGYHASVAFVAGEGLIVTLIFILLRKQIAGLFFHDPEGVKIFCAYLCVVGISEMFMNTEMMTSGALAGLGRTHVSSVICVVFTLIRLPLAYGLAAFTTLGSTSVWLAISISSILKGLLMFAAFQKCSAHIDK